MINKSFIGKITLSFNASSKTEEVTGDLSFDEGVIKGSLKTNTSEQILPINCTYTGTAISSSSINTVIVQAFSGLPNFIAGLTYTGNHSNYEVITLAVSGVSSDGLVTITGNLTITTNSTGFYSDASGVTDTTETYSLSKVKINTKRNPWDNIAFISGVERIGEETNYDLKKKILRAGHNGMDTTYEGLIYAISIELGLSVEDSLEIHEKKGAYTSVDTPSYPLLVCDGAFLRLFYNHYLTENIDFDIEIPLRTDDSITTINDVAAYINTNSTYFGATVHSLGTLPAHCLMIKTNETIQSYDLEASTRIDLTGVNVVRDSIRFSSTSTFYNHVQSVAYVVAPGDYYVNYDNGILTSQLLPEAGTQVTYRWLEFPFKFKASPVSILAFNTRAMERLIFNQEFVYNDTNDPSEATINTYPTEKGMIYITDLLKKHKVLWGK